MASKTIKQPAIETKITETVAPTSTPTHSGSGVNTRDTHELTDRVVDTEIVNVPTPDTVPFDRSPSPSVKKAGVTAQKVDRETGANTTDSGRFRSS